MTEEETAEELNEEEESGGTAQQDTQPAEGNEAQQGKDAAADVPPEYSFKFKDGEEMSEEYVNNFKKLAGELKLSPEQAQAVMAHNAAFYHGDRSRIDAEIQAQAKQYKDEARAELGDRFNETLSFAAKALDKYDKDGALRHVLDVLPIGNNVQLIKVFARMGKDIAEDRLVKGGNAGGGTSLEERMFPGFKN